MVEWLHGDRVWQKTGIEKQEVESGEPHRKPPQETREAREPPWGAAGDQKCTSKGI